MTHSIAQPFKPSGTSRLVEWIRGSSAVANSTRVWLVLLAFVGLVNLVPLPPLDGGHLAALAYEKIRRRRPDIRKLVPLTTVVAAFLILFSLSLIYIDITKPIPNPFR